MSYRTKIVNNNNNNDDNVIENIQERTDAGTQRKEDIREVLSSVVVVKYIGDGEASYNIIASLLVEQAVLSYRNSYQNDVIIS